MNKLNLHEAPRQHQPTRNFHAILIATMEFKRDKNSNYSRYFIAWKRRRGVINEYETFASFLIKYNSEFFPPWLCSAAIAIVCNDDHDFFAPAFWKCWYRLVRRSFFIVIGISLHWNPFYICYYSNLIVSSTLKFCRRHYFIPFRMLNTLSFLCVFFSRLHSYSYAAAPLHE